MKHLAIVLALLQIAAPLIAQQPEAGFLKVVNLVSLKTPTHIQMGDFDFDSGRPIPAGDDSGTLALKPDSYRIMVTNEGAEPKSETIDFQVENARNVVVMCYDETMEKKDGEQFSRLRFNLLTEAPALDEPRLSIVSLLKQSTTNVQIGRESVILTDRKAHRIDPKIGDTFRIEFRGKLVGEIEIADPTHYIAFLYRDPETDEVSLSLIQNEKLEYHPPLEDDEDSQDATE